MDDLVGTFFDPFHGGCLRRIVRTKQDHYKILGVYGNDEPPANPGDSWTATATVVERTYALTKLSVHFGGKRIINHKLTYIAVWRPCKRCLQWEDGNVWRKAYTQKNI